MPEGPPKRILIVDDSAVMRSLLRSVLSSDPRLQVAGTAADGASALQSVATLAPDLMLLDVEMPVMDGITTLKKLRSAGHRLPVIMCSVLTQRGARVTIDALARGASDYVTKPTAQENRETALRTLAADLLPKIHALVRTAPAQPQPLTLPLPRQIPPAVPAVLAIGVSTGGPEALEQLLPSLPDYFPLPVVIVQHMPELFTALLAERLDRNCMLRVYEASEGAPLVPGRIYIARGNMHLEVLRASAASQCPTLHLTDGQLENHCRPSVNVLFRSLTCAYGGHVLAVMLTGMGSDGLAGCRVLHALGATILAQDEASSAVWGMPGAVVAAGLAHSVLPLRQISAEILRLTAQRPGEPGVRGEAPV